MITFPSTSHEELIQELNNTAQYCNLKVDFKYLNSLEFIEQCNQVLIDRIMNLIHQMDKAHEAFGDVYLPFSRLDALDVNEAYDVCEEMMNHLEPIGDALEILSNRMELPITGDDAYEKYLNQLADYTHPSEA
jgi:hypothetical protein